MSDLATRMAAAMKAAALNQPQLAGAASTIGVPVSQQVVQHLLSGRNKSSSHLPAIAEALGVSLEWLATGRDAAENRKAGALLIGKVGAGDEVTRFGTVPVLSGVISPSGIDAPNVLEISGDFQRPLQHGWLIFYGPEHQGISDDCMDKLCVVQIKDGPTLFKTVRKGSRKGVFRLESWNTTTRKDVKLLWVARVTDIRPM